MPQLSPGDSAIGARVPNGDHEFGWQSIKRQELFLGERHVEIARGTRTAILRCVHGHGSRDEPRHHEQRGPALSQ